MRRSRTEPPPRTPQERDAARAERERRRAARRGDPAPRIEPDLGREAGVGSLAAEPLTREHEAAAEPLTREHEAAEALRRGFEADAEPEYSRAAELETPMPVDAPAAAGSRARNTAIFSVLTGLS